jgi:branched-chain amino acid transport system permease protein
LSRFDNRKPAFLQKNPRASAFIRVRFFELSIAEDKGAGLTRGDKFLYALCGVILLSAVVLPFTGLMSGFWLRTITLVFILGLMAQGWNFIGGYTGYSTFGNVAYFGAGAYVTGILMTKWNVGFIPSILASALFCAAFGALIGVPLLRLRGHYFAVATIGIANALREIVAGWDSVTGGGIGINLPLNIDEHFYRNIYFLLLGMLVCVFLLTYYLSHSRLGYGWLAIRENEDAAKALGINATLYKTIAFTIACAIVGMTGGVYAYYNASIAPDTVFDSVYSVTPILIVILGGTGTVAGPLIGSFVYQILSTLLLFNFPGWQQSLLGVTIILVIIFLPNGLFEYLTGRRVLGLTALLESPRVNRA